MSLDVKDHSITITECQLARATGIFKPVESFWLRCRLNIGIFEKHPRQF